MAVRGSPPSRRAVRPSHATAPGPWLIRWHALVSPPASLAGVEDPYNEEHQFTPHIFQYPGSNDVFFVPDQLEVKPYASCEFSATSKSFSSASSYARTMAASVGVSVDLASIGALSASSSVSHASQGMQSGSKDLFMNTAECLTSAVELVAADKFDPFFVKQFNALPAEPVDPEQVDNPASASTVRAYMSFFDVFGTHMIPATDLGGTLEQWTFVSKSTVKHESSTSVSAGMSAEASVLGSSASASASASSDKKQSSESSQSSSETEVVAHGGEPGSFASEMGTGHVTWGEWAGTVPGNPVTVNPQYRPMSEVLKGVNPEVCSVISPSDAAGCEKRFNNLDLLTTLYIKRRAHPMDMQYSIYVAVSRDAKGAEAQKDYDAEVEGKTANLPPAKAKALTAASEGKKDDMVNVCEFKCLRKSMGSPINGKTCREDMEPLRVLESQAKGCASMKEGAYSKDAALKGMCKAQRDSTCDGSVQFVKVTKMTALEASDNVDTPATGAGAAKAIESATAKGTICRYQCLENKAMLGSSTYCGNYFAYLSENAVPKCHISKAGDAMKDPAIQEQCQAQSPQCKSNAGKFVGSFTGAVSSAAESGKTTTDVLQEEGKKQADLALSAPGDRVRKCEFLCLPCGKKQPDAKVVVEQGVANGCSNMKVGDEAAVQEAVNQCQALKGCTGKKSRLLSVFDEPRSTAPKPKPGKMCKFSCGETGKNVWLTEEDVPGCGSMAAGTASPAAVRQCSYLSGLEYKKELTAKFVAAEDVDNVFAGKSDTGGARFRSTARMITPAASSSPSSVAQSDDAMMADIGAEDSLVLAEMAQSDSAKEVIEEAPVVTIRGERGEIMSWNLAEKGRAVLEDGAITRLTRTSPGIGSIKEIEVSAFPDNRIRFLRITNDDMGVEYVFDTQGETGPLPARDEKRNAVTLTPVALREFLAEKEYRVSPSLSVLPFYTVDPAEQSEDGSSSNTNSTGSGSGGGSSSASAEVAAESQKDGSNSHTVLKPLTPPGAGEEAHPQFTDKMNRYEFFITTSRGQFIGRRGDVTVTLTGDKGMVTVPAPVYQERTWATIGHWNQLAKPVETEDGEKSNKEASFLKVAFRDPSYRNFLGREDRRKSRVAFFSYEGTDVGTLRSVRIEVAPSEKGAQPLVWTAPARVQADAARDICRGLTMSYDVGPTSDCQQLDGKHGRSPNFPMIQRMREIAGVGLAQCEQVKAAIERGNDEFKCEWDEKQSVWLKKPQGDDDNTMGADGSGSGSGSGNDAKSSKRMMGLRRFQPKCETKKVARGSDFCTEFFHPRSWFTSADGTLDLSSVRMLRAEDVKVFDYRKNRAYTIPFGTTVSEFDSNGVERRAMGV